ncbi:MAG TPA: hypothetical protein VIJ52_00935 [Pseudolabrys sp.]
MTPPDVASARPLDSIKNRGILLVCANPNALPFSSKTGDRRGFELELGEALANQLEVGWVVFPNQVFGKTSRARVRVISVVNAVNREHALLAKAATPLRRPASVTSGSRSGYFATLPCG